MGKYYYLVFYFTLSAFLACAPLIKTDLDSYLQDQAYYKGKQVVITADLENILERYELYQGKEVEFSAPVTYFGKWQFRTWYLMLEKDGKKIRCYENEYRIYPGRDALSLLRIVKSEGGEITVRGKVKPDGIELNRLIYKEYAVNTNSKPPEFRMPFFGGTSSPF